MRRRTQCTGFPRNPSCLSPAAWLASPKSIRTRIAGVIPSSGDIHLFSIVVGFGVGTLLATGLLFVMHILEDFRGA